jgi:hypothetical protein
MGTITDRLSISNATFNADFAINIKARSQFQNQTRYWLNIVPDVLPTACLVTVNYTPVGGVSIAALDANGNAITIDLTAPRPVYIDGDISVITLVHSGLTVGGMTSYTATVSADTGGNGLSKGNASASPAVSIADGANVTLGAKADSAATTDTGTFSLVALIKRGLQNWTSLLAKFSATASTDTNRLPISQLDGLTVSGSGASVNAVLFTTSMLGYESITVQVTNAATATITYETSDDNTNWFACAGLAVAATGANVPTNITTSVVAMQFQRKCLYFRARLSSWTTGTVTVVGTLSKVPVNVSVPAIYGGYSETAALGGGLLSTVLESRTTSKTSVASAAAVRPIATQDGRQVTRQNSIPENEWAYAAASNGITNTTTAVTIVAAQAAGIRNYLTSLQLSSDVLGAATEIAIRDGAGGAVLWRGKVGTAGITGVSTILFSDPLKSTAATLLEVVTLTASVTGGVYVNAQGYIAP